MFLCRALPSLKLLPVIRTHTLVVFVRFYFTRQPVPCAEMCLIMSFHPVDGVAAAAAVRTAEQSCTVMKRMCNVPGPYSSVSRLCLLIAAMRRSKTDSENIMFIILIFCSFCCCCCCCGFLVVQESPHNLKRCEQTFILKQRCGSSFSIDEPLLCQRDTQLILFNMNDSPLWCWF